MFYCDECAENNKHPYPTLCRSFGPCEICGETRTCNDLSSKFLLKIKENQNETKKKLTPKE